MDSESSEEQTSTECSTDSSDDDEKLETAQICGVRLQLPQGLCERQDIFEEFFSAHTWNSLSEIHRQHLKNFLPTFPENDEFEKNITLRKLFNSEVFRFNSPLLQFHDNLKAGHYRPDISKMRKLIKKAERTETKFRHKLYRQRLRSEVEQSRIKLLSLVENLPPGIEPRMDKLDPSIQSYVNPISHRTKRRYFQELKEVREKVEETGFSSDENYPEGPSVPLSRKQKRHLNSIKNSALNSSKVYSTFSTKSNYLDLERLVIPNHNPFSISDEYYKNTLVNHKRIRLDNPSEPEYNTTGITVSDIISRTDLTNFKKLCTPVTVTKPLETKPTHHKKKSKREPPPISQSPELVNKLNPFFGHSSNSDSDSDSLFDSLSIKNKIKTKKPVVKLPPKEQSQSPISLESKPIVDEPSPPKTLNCSPQFTKIAPATVSDLDGIDMMNLPIDLEDSSIDILELNKPELMQETHSNFLSLIRDIICSTNEHRMSLKTLEQRLKTWQENPITPLNDWYNLSDNWVLLLPSAINFLNGNCLEQPDDFVPYIEYKTKVDMHQWIGAGRDSDSLLAPLCQYWLEHRNQMKPSAAKDKESEAEMMARCQTPPPPRCPTTWSIRKANIDEVKSFQEQEFKRYNNPHKSFTYRCNGYESVVGPVKGVYNNQNMGSTKARGHSVLTADRPNFVTILTLVRDATARLPNGEGTRGDICELLKASQYLSTNVPDNVLQSVVSGALDRMHTQFDPCVKYEPKRKVWIYLHRNRNEEDFERLHQQYQGMSKNVKKVPSKSKPKPKSKTVVKVSADSTTPTETPSETKAPIQVSPTEQLETKSKQINSDVAVKTQLARKSPVKQLPKQEKVIETAVTLSQSPTPPLVKHPHPQINKSIVKVISSAQGKSLIIPTSNTQILKHIERSQVLNKQINQTIAQQKARQLSLEQKANPKLSVALQQQIIQSVTPKLQNIKNVALLKSAPIVSAASSVAVNISQPGVATIKNSIIVTTTSQSIVQEQVIQSGVQNKVAQPRLTPAQQQQILQSLKQKVLPLQQTVMSSQYRTISKQKVGIQQIQKATGATSLLNQGKITVTDGNNIKPIITTSQTPLVAKVLTNAAGQVISVDSLLAHQKQHGSLPQGTTLRISGTKGGQSSVIQIASSSQSPVTQFTVANANIANITNQTKFIVSTPVTTLGTSTITVAKPVLKSTSKIQAAATTGKFIPKLGQQLVNAKLSVANQKIVQPKVIVGPPNQLKVPISSKSISISKPIGINVNAGANTIRMVNANLNIAQIAGKPVLITSKGSTFQNIHGQNIIIQTQANTNSPGLIISNPDKTITNTTLNQQNTSSSLNIANQQSAQVILSPTIKMQPTSQVVLGNSIKSTGVSLAQANQGVSTNQIVLGGQTVRLQATGLPNTHRVVLASQNQGQIMQQILLPVGYQGTPINIKNLQGIKVVPLAQTQGKGVPGRQVFARVMNPANIVRVTQSAEATDAPNPSKSTVD